VLYDKYLSVHGDVEERVRETGGGINFAFAMLNPIAIPGFQFSGIVETWKNGRLGASSIQCYQPACLNKSKRRRASFWAANTFSK
jgi:hypothetical protein